MRHFIPRMGHTLLLTATLMLPSALFAQDAPPSDTGPDALLKAIPQDAVAFGAIRNLDEFDKDINELVAGFGLPVGPGGMFPGALAWVKEQIQITDGLKTDSGVGVALLSCEGLETPEEIPSRFVLFIPTGDAAALAETLGGQKDGDVYKLMLGPDPSFAAPKGDFLVIAQNADNLKAALKPGEGIAKSLHADRRKAYAGSDIYVWLNVKGIPANLKTQLLDAFAGLMQMGMMADPAMAAQADQAQTQVGKFIEQSDQLALRLGVNPKTGIDGFLYFSFQADSELGKLVAESPTADGSLLLGLPDEPTIFTYGGVQTAGAEEQIRQGLDQLFKLAESEGDVDKEKLGQLKESVVHLLLVKSVSFGLSGLPAPNPDGLLSLTFVAGVENSNKWRGELKKAFDLAKEIIVDAAKNENANLPEEQIKSISEAIAYKENAEQLGGMRVDHFVVDLSGMPDTQEEDIAEMKGVLGQEGLLLRIAAPDDTHVAIMFGGGAKRFERIAEHVRKGEAPLGGNKFINTVSQRLPTEGRMQEGYFHLENLLSTVIDIMTEVNQPFPFPIQLDPTMPIGFTSNKSGEAGVETGFLLPKELLVTVQQTVANFMQAFMGPMPVEDEGEEAPPLTNPDGELN